MQTTTKQITPKYTQTQEPKQAFGNLIEELVRDRNPKENTYEKTDDRDNPDISPDIKKKANLWEKLRREPFYILEISLKVGPASVRIDGSDLGIKQEVLDELAEIASFGYKAKFKSLEAAANKLKKFVDRVYQYSLVVEPLRVVHQKHLPATIQAIEELKAEAQKLREQLLANYDRDYAIYLESIHKFLFLSELSSERIEATMRRYAEAYPAPDTFKLESLQVIIKRLEKIPSLLEQVQKDTQLAKAQAEREQAEIELQKIQLFQTAQKALENDLLSILSQASFRSRDEAFGQFAELVDRMGGLTPEQITNKSQSAWNAIFERLEILALHDEQVGVLLDEAKKLQELYQISETPVDIVQAQLDRFREILKKTVKKDSGEGASRLSKVLSLEDSYKYLCSQLEALESTPDLVQMQALEAKINALENVFQFRHLDLKRRKTKVKKALAKSMGIRFSELGSLPLDVPDISKKEDVDELQSVRATQRSQAYDPEAGF